MPELEVTPQELTNRLNSGPLVEGDISAPVEPRRSHLPFHELTWKQFEHLCLSMVEHDPRVEFAHMYGVEGEDQDGIDLFGTQRNSDKAIVFQCKRVEDFGPKKIQAVIDLFLRQDKNGQPLKDKDGHVLPERFDEEGDRIPHWYEEADTFVLCLSRPLDTTSQQQAWRKAQHRLKQFGIQGELWDQSVLERKLQKLPELVDRYFNRAWVIAFNGPEAADALKRLARREAEAMAAIHQALRTDVRDELDRGVNLTSAARDQFKTELVDELAERFAAPLPVLPPGAGDSPLGQDLNRLRTLIEAGAVQAATDQAEELRPLAEAATPQLHAEFLRLEGSLLYHQERPEATDRWLKAFDLDDQPEAAVILKGLAHLLRGEAGVALEFLKIAHRRAPERQDVLSMLASTWHKVGDIAQYDALEHALTPEQVEVGVACVRIHQIQKDTVGMRRVLAVLESGSHAEDPHVRLLLAKAMLQDVLTDLQHVHGDLRTLHVQNHPLLPVILAHLDASITAFRRPKELWALRLEALNARQVVYNLSGQDHLSLQDGLEALQLRPDEPGIQFNVALTYLRTGDDHAALQMLKAGGGQLLEQVPQVRLIFSAAARRSGAPDLALELADPLRTAPDLTLRMETLEERVRTLIALKQLDTAQSETDEAGAAGGEVAGHPTLEVCRALILDARGEVPQAQAAFERAIHLASGFERIQISVQLILFLRRQNDWKGAAEVARSLNLDDLPSDWLELVIEVLYAGGDSEAARNAARLRRLRGAPEHLWTLRVEAWLATWDGDLPAALTVYQELLQRWPGDARALAEAAAVYSRLGRRQRVRELLEQLLVSTTTEYKILMHGAEAARLMSLEKLAKSLGYRALRLGFGDENTHVQFFNVMRAFQERGSFKTVKAETAVQCQVGEGESRWVVLTADEHPEVSRGEYALSDPLAQVLLGKRVGQSVQLPSGDVYKVLKIVSKFENAERMWLTEGRQLFPTTERLRALRIGELEFLPQGLWDMLKAGQEQGKEAMRLVREQHLPMSFMMIRRHDHEARFWDNVLEGRREMTVNTGDPVTLEDARAMATTRKIMLHTSAVMVLTHTHLLRNLLQNRKLPGRPAHSREILVTRQTMDDLKLAIREAEDEAEQGGRTTMYYNGDRPVMERETPEEGQERLRRLRSALSLLKEHATVVPAYGLQAFFEQAPELDKATATVSTYLAAKTQGAFVLCDDLNLVRLARYGLFETPVRGASSVLFMDALHQDGQRSDTEHTAAKLKFAGAQQVVIPNLEEGDLRALLGAGPLQFDWQTLGLLRSLVDRDLPLAGVAQNVALILKHGLVQAALDVTREGWMREVLTAALDERDLLEFAAAIDRTLRFQLRLLPTVEVQALDVLNRWSHDTWRRTGGRDLGNP